MDQAYLDQIELIEKRKKEKIKDKIQNENENQISKK
jgi:hypothetical protein